MAPGVGLPAGPQGSRRLVHGRRAGRRQPNSSIRSTSSITNHSHKSMNSFRRALLVTVPHSAATGQPQQMLAPCLADQVQLVRSPQIPAPVQPEAEAA